MREKADLLVCNGTLLTIDDNRTIIESGDLAIQKDTIIAIGRNLSKRFHCSKIIDASEKLVMPGLINCHAHSAMTIFRGLADDLSLMDWLQNHIFPAEARFINPENVYTGTLLACIEMIKSGTTTVCDGYFFESEAARALNDAGLRGVMAQGIIDFPCPDAQNSQEGLQLAEGFIQQWKNSDRIVPGIFCHSAYTCHPQTLQKAKEKALKYKVPFCIHLSETKEEIEQVVQKYGKRPVPYLADLGVLDENVIAIHCVWLTSEEIKLLKENKVKIVYVPESNMKLASGIAPVPEFFKQGILVGLGTDSAAGNNDLDLFLEMDTAAKLQKIALKDSTVMKAEEVVLMVTRNGAKVLGLEDKIGSLEVGKKADLIVIDLKKPHLLPLYNLYSHLVYALSGPDVDVVIVDGKVLMENRKLLLLDEKEIMERVVSLSNLIR